MNKTTLLFPGQASQYVGMGKMLYEQYDFVKKLFSEANEVLGFDITSMCFNGNLEELTHTENTQPALLVCSVAAYHVFRHEFSVTPDFVAGHSIGEISALTCVGAIKFRDALQIVRKRGLLMKEVLGNGKGKMSAIAGVDPELIEQACAEYSQTGDKVVISNYNSTNQYVISGLENGVKEVGAKLEKLGAKVYPLNVSAPFHSPYMQNAADKFREALQKYTFSSFQTPVISNIDAQPYSDPSLIIDKLVKQLVAPVQWVKSIRYLELQGVTMAIELGPKTVLKSLVQSITPAIRVYSSDNKDDVETLRDNLLTFINKCLAISVCTKNNNWDNDEYKKGVSEPYSQVQQMLEKLEADGTLPTIKQAKESLEMLISVFKTKKVPEKEQEQRFEELFSSTETYSFFERF
jgi:malonyl CoA-acyl carrier protein transacylase